MKNLFILLLLFCSNFLLAQNGIYSVGPLVAATNMSIESVDNSTLNIAGTFEKGGQAQGYLSQYQTGGAQLWSTELSINGLPTIISDQVYLPSGLTAVTGVYEANPGTLDPFVMLLDAAGQVVNTMGYSGFNFPYSQTHKIVYSEFGQYLLICGANRDDSPLGNAFSYVQDAFVLAVNLDNLGIVWSTMMDSGQATNGLDYDLAESMTVSEFGMIFVTGSMNRNNSSSQLLMLARLDPDNGQSLYTDGWLFGPNACGADLYYEYASDVLHVLGNSSSGLTVSCFDPHTGQPNNQTAIIDAIGIPANWKITGSKLEGLADTELAMLSGYFTDQTTNPTPNQKLIPFLVELNLSLEDCSVDLPNEGKYFAGNNNFPPSNGAYGQVISPDYLNTQDMMIIDFMNYQTHLVGYRDHEVDIIEFDYDGTCDLACVTNFTPTRNSINNQLFNQNIFLPFNVNPFVENGISIGRWDNRIEQCAIQPFACASNCPVVIDTICETRFILSVDCYDSCYGAPTTRWQLPGLGIDETNNNGLLLDLTTSGTYNYTVTVSQTLQGQTYDCVYTGSLVLGPLGCTDFQFDVTINPIGCTEYALTIDHNLTNCVDVVFSTNISRLIDPATYLSCAVLAQDPSNPVIFDISNCGEGNYGYNITAVVYRNGVAIDNCTITGLEFLADNTINPTYTWTYVTNSFPSEFCNGGDYFFYQVTSPVNSAMNPNRYQYFWNNSIISTGPSFVCCDDPSATCYNPQVRIVDTETGCETTITDFYTTSAPEYGSEKPVNEFEERTIETVVTSLEVQVYPNPTSSMVELRTSSSGLIVVTIFNMNGRALSNKLMDQSDSTINLSELPSGVYILQVIDQSTGEKVTKRIMKI